MKKPNMFRILLTTVSMAAFAPGPWPVCGQQAPVEAVREANAPIVEHLKVQDGQIFKRQPGPGANWVDCGIANVGNAIMALRDLYPSATFAADPQVAEVRLTDVVVRADDPMTDLEALRTCCGGKFNLNYQQRGLFTLEANNLTEHNSSAAAERKIDCFNLTGYLQREKALGTDETNTNNGMPGFPNPLAMKQSEAVARLQDIIEQTIEDFDPTARRDLHFRFYGEAHLLIVIGSNRALEVAAKVIDALPGQQASSRKRFGGEIYGEDQKLLQQMTPARVARMKNGVSMAPNPAAAEENFNDSK